MGARLIARRAQRRAAAVAVAVGALVSSGCASSSASGEIPTTTASPAATSAAEPTTAVTTTTAATSAPTASASPPTTVAPTTAPATTTSTTVVPDPTEAPCPEVPPPARDLSASLDREPFEPPADFVATRPLPSGGFAVRTGSPAAQAAAATADPGARAVLTRLAGVPNALSVGDWLGDGVTATVAQASAAASSAGSISVLQIYNLPHRDAGGGFSAGGAPTADAYRAFTAAVIAGIGATNTIVILEPDSLGQMRSLNAAQQRERYDLLNETVDAYATLPNAWVYLDAAHCGWLSAEVNAQRLLRAGVARAQGFFVNVANYQPTAAEVWRAHQIALLTGGRHFVVDTGRNGNGPFVGALTNRWCNPPDRALGTEPTRGTASRFADAYLWIKQPGASDGTCGRGNPAAGAFWPERAVELAHNTGW